jgi:hypothetical protein
MLLTTVSIASMPESIKKVTLDPVFVKNISANKSKISLKLRMPLEQEQVLHGIYRRQLIALSVLYIADNHPQYAETIIRNVWRGVFEERPSEQLPNLFFELAGRKKLITRYRQGMTYYRINTQGEEFLADKGIFEKSLKQKLDSFRIELDTILNPVIEAVIVEYGEQVRLKMSQRLAVNWVTREDLDTILIESGYSGDADQFIRAATAHGLLHQRRYRYSATKVVTLNSYVLGKEARL